MRGLKLCPVVLAAWLAGADSLQAGVYLLEPVPTLLPPLYKPERVAFENVRQERENLQTADDRRYPPPPASPRRTSPSRDYYLQLADRLEKQHKGGFFCGRDAVTLSGCLLRLGRPGAAASVATEALDRLRPKDPVRFLLLLNRACAYMEQNDFHLLDRAVQDQRDALDSWPALWAGWDQQQWRWQRRLEQYTLTWMRQRLFEQERNNRQPPSTPTLDAIFDTPTQKVRFVGPGGKTYQAGALDFKEENKLPRDAENLVIALLLAHPYDPRLWWLYGELLNAHGQVGTARAILDGLIGMAQLDSSELRAHRKVLFADEAALALADPNNQGALRKLFWAVAPRGQLLGGGLADVAQETGWLAVIASTQPPPLEPEVGVDRTSDRSSPAAADPLPTWRQTAIGFAAGVVVGLLAALQWLEWRRRRRETAWSAPPRASHSKDV